MTSTNKQRRYIRNCEVCGQRDYCHESDDGLMECSECRENEGGTIKVQIDSNTSQITTRKAQRKRLGAR